jgi:hypothetical protein
VEPGRRIEALVQAGDLAAMLQGEAPAARPAGSEKLRIEARARGTTRAVGAADRGTAAGLPAAGGHGGPGPGGSWPMSGAGSVEISACRACWPDRLRTAPIRSGPGGRRSWRTCSSREHLRADSGAHFGMMYSAPMGERPQSAAPGPWPAAGAVVLFFVELLAFAASGPPAGRADHRRVSVGGLNRPRRCSACCGPTTPLGCTTASS